MIFSQKQTNMKEAYVPPQGKDQQFIEKISSDDITGLDELHDTENDYFELTKIDVLTEKPLDTVDEVQHSCSSDDEYSTVQSDSTYGFVEKHMERINWSEEMDSAPSARSEWVSGEKGLTKRIEKRWGDNWDGKTNTGSFDNAICYGRRCII
jgi:hypothetical protein